MTVLFTLEHLKVVAWVIGLVVSHVTAAKLWAKKAVAAAKADVAKVFAEAKAEVLKVNATAAGIVKHIENKIKSTL